MRGEGFTADVGVRRNRPRPRRGFRALPLLAVAALITSLALSVTLLASPSGTRARDSIPTSAPGAPTNNSYCLNVYCFNANGKVFSFLGTSIAVFAWDLTHPADYAYRYANTSIWFSDGQYHVSQQVESVAKTFPRGLGWGPDSAFSNGYYEGLGLRTWINGWAGISFTLMLKENNGKELGRWDYHGQSVLYLGASSSTSGMNIAFDDWQQGLWFPSDSLYFEYPSWAGLAFNNASLDVMVMIPCYVDIPEFSIIIPMCGSAVIMIAIRRWRGGTSTPTPASPHLID